MHRLQVEEGLLVAAVAEPRYLLPEKLLLIAAVRPVAPLAALSREGAVEKRIVRHVVVALAADLVDPLTDFPSPVGIAVAGPAVALGEGVVLEGVEEGGIVGAVGVVALAAGGAFEGVAPVGGADGVALQVVAAGAESVLPVEKDQGVVRPVVEMAGAAMAPADGEVDVGPGEALDLPVMAGTAPPVDALFQGCRLGEVEALVPGRLLLRRRGRGRGEGDCPVAAVGLGAVAADAALPAAGGGFEMPVRRKRPPKPGLTPLLD
jgi:hypothetical protein